MTLHCEKSQKVIHAFATTEGFYTVGPFTTTSGTVTPIYPDSRHTFSNPQKMKLIAREVREFILRRRISFDIILGGATAGIQPATALALLMNKPMGYIRTKPKEGGLGRAIEGAWKPGMKAIIIDDATGHGEAKSKFVQHIRNAGMEVEWVIVILARSTRYSTKNFSWLKKARVKFQAFGDCADVANESYRLGLITKDAKILLNWYEQDAHAWHKDPKKWALYQAYLNTKHTSPLGV